MSNKSTNYIQTNIELEDAYNNLKEIMGKLKKTDFGSIIHKKKQNIGGRISYKGKLFYDEAALILDFLNSEGKTNTDFYKTLFNVVYSVKPTILQSLPQEEVNSSNIDEFVDLNVRGDVGLSCGYGSVAYNDEVTGKCRVSRKALNKYGARTSSTEVVYAQGDSMIPEIQSGDALLVDTSQTEIIDGVVYAFNYDGQPMCKRLQKIGKEIKAISTNPAYDPFIIDFTYQFNIVGRVIGFMRSVS